MHLISKRQNGRFGSNCGLQGGCLSFGLLHLSNAQSCVFLKYLFAIYIFSPCFIICKAKRVCFLQTLFGADRRIRTSDLFITSELLCQLSYISIFNFLFATLAEPKALPHCEHSSCGLWLATVYPTVGFTRRPK